ncbi:MAG: hypothetical protein HXY30_17300 [Pseudorhodoplanes sp.]|nr:hypothetical protein [Pseudorhodoplanes sp.]
MLQHSALARLAQIFARKPLPAFTPRAARGIRDPHCPGSRRIVVTIDEATFAAIGRAALASNVRTSEAIRQLIRRGLDASPVREN